MTMAPATRALPLACLMLLLLRRDPGVGAQVAPDFKLQQPQDKVSVTVGGTLSLTCTTSRGSPVGPVKWLKGWGSGNQTIYEQMGSFPRVTRVVNGSNTDFSIHIRNVRPEDAGTYYCVKFRIIVPEGEELVQRGKGTEVSVFVSPSVRVDADPPSPIGVNKTVKFTCNVKGFYPGDVTVTWLENGMAMSVEDTSRLVEMPQGLFHLSSVVEVRATEEKNGSKFTCRVVHDGQAPVESTTTLWIAAPDGEGVSLNLLSSPGLWLGILLEKGLLGGLLVFLFKRARA